jgi:CubicO group peptidase (beta-lactamase class C family)
MWNAALSSLVAAAIAQSAVAQSVAPVTRVDSMNGAVGRALHARMLTLADSGWSGAVIVVRNDTVLLAAGYGMANRERQIPFTASTVAQIGSITKPFTATAIADLVRRGKLRYADSLGGLFDNLPAAARGITIDMLLSHKAGLAEACGDDFAHLSKDDLLRRCLAQPFAHPPGQTFQYSNLGYSILAAVVERVSGESLEAYLSDHFLAPLQLESVGYQLPNVPADRLALGYTGTRSQPNMRDQMARLGADYWNLKGNGGMQASVFDMYRWCRALDRGSLISSDMRRALFSPHAERDPGVFYGYGWFLRVDSLGRTTQVSHSGSDGTFVALWYWRPLDRVFIYTVSNFGQNDLATGTVAALRGALNPSR